jgi:starch synthase
MNRALLVYNQKDEMKNLIYANMNFDFAWEKSAEKYIALYNN